MKDIKRQHWKYCMPGLIEFQIVNYMYHIQASKGERWEYTALYTLYNYHTEND
jgi:hypothetical protein